MDQDGARRAAAEVTFDGIDISKPLQGNLLSLTYTEAEEDEADDLQIKIADREGEWLCQWIDDAVEAAASGYTAISGSDTYQVTAQIGLNVRSGPGTAYRKLGALTYGALLQVSAISNGWASTTYKGQKAYVSASYISVAAATSGTVGTGLHIQAALRTEHWGDSGEEKTLDCGRFELDTINADGPPSTVTIKATSLPYDAQIRQTKRSKVWEACKLSGIVHDIAGGNGMSCLFESGYDPYYQRVEQSKTSDISFLSGLCHDAGLSLKITNNVIVLFEQAAYEAKAPVLTIKRGDGSYIKYKFSTGKADTAYSSCRVSYTDPATGGVIEATAYAPNYDPEGKKNQCLEVTAKVLSVGEAMELAGKRLRLHNKYRRTATFTMPGNPELLSGLTVWLDGWGSRDGKYLICQTRHTLGSSGYITQITMRSGLEGY